MAGGTFSSMNKKRPGAYINFETSPTVSTIGISDRGIVTMPLALSWGDSAKLIEVTGSDLANGNLLAKVGFIYTDTEALPINLALQNCQSIKIYNTNKSGVKASKTLDTLVTYSLTTDTTIDNTKTYYTRSGAGTEESPYVYTAVGTPDVADIATYYEREETTGLKITAKYAGTFGNKIAIVIQQNEDIFTVDTYANGYYVDSQNVKTSADLVANDYVEFDNGALQTISSTLLTGGTNGTTDTALTNYFELLLTEQWTTLALMDNTEALKLSVINFIKQAREDEGKYVQAVLANVPVSKANYEGIINVVNGVILEDDTTITAEQFTAWVAGATAGASITESLTGKVVANAVSIVGALNNQQIIDGLQEGKFILSLNQNGSIKVEKDINSLHTFTDEKSYIFSKNRVIRELDEIGTSIKNIWETIYLGKISNNENGRTLFKSSIIDYLTTLQNLGALEEVDISKIYVEKGNDIDSVIASIAVRPVDSMEFLYMTVNIEE